MAKFCMLFILCVGCFLVTNFYSWEHDDQIAHDYVEMIKPRLMEFRQTSGHYPNAIEEIANLPPAPRGLSYYTDPTDDAYGFDYYEDNYFSGTGQWSEDD